MSVPGLHLSGETNVYGDNGIYVEKAPEGRARLEGKTQVESWLSAASFN